MRLPPLLALSAAAVLLSSSCSGDRQDVTGPTAGGSPPPSLGSRTAGATASPRPSPRPRATRPSPAPSPRPRRVHYSFPVQGCRASYGHSHHDYPATDVFAPRGCRVVSPVAGTVDEVSTVDRWDPSTNRGADRGGLSFSVVGTDGVRYYGSHLSTVLVRPGQHVVAGQMVGTVGSSGSARGVSPHLHVGISWPTRHGVWWVRRGEVYPWRYLDSWRSGGNRSPASAVATLHRQRGDVPPCSIDC